MSKERPYWTSAEADEWRAFLQTDTGKKLLFALAEERPRLLRGGPTNEILVRSGESLHHQSIEEMMLELQGSEMTAEVSPDFFTPDPFYAPLEDDLKWPGPKLKEPE